MTLAQSHKVRHPSRGKRQPRSADGTCLGCQRRLDERDYVVELFVPESTRVTLSATFLTASMGFSSDEGVSEAAVPHI
jgi:hypothetical protein